MKQGVLAQPDKAGVAAVELRRIASGGWDGLGDRSAERCLASRMPMLATLRCFTPDGTGVRTTSRCSPAGFAAREGVLNRSRPATASELEGGHADVGVGLAGGWRCDREAGAEVAKFEVGSVDLLS